MEKGNNSLDYLTLAKDLEPVKKGTASSLTFTTGVQIPDPLETGDHDGER